MVLVIWNVRVQAYSDQMGLIDIARNNILWDNDITMSAFDNYTLT